MPMTMKHAPVPPASGVELLKGTLGFIIVLAFCLACWSLFCHAAAWALRDLPVIWSWYL